MSNHRNKNSILREISAIVGGEVKGATNTMYIMHRNSVFPLYSKFNASWHIQQLPGCCGVGVVSNTHYSNLPKRNAEKVRELVCEYQEAVAREDYRFGALIQTHTLGNKNYQSTVSKRGYTEGMVFRNPKTQNKVTIDIIEV